MRCVLYDAVSKRSLQIILNPCCGVCTQVGVQTALVAPIIYYLVICRAITSTRPKWLNWYNRYIIQNNKKVIQRRDSRVFTFKMQHNTQCLSNCSTWSARVSNIQKCHRIPGHKNHWALIGRTSNYSYPLIYSTSLHKWLFSLFSHL